MVLPVIEMKFKNYFKLIDAINITVIMKNNNDNIVKYLYTIINGL
jgi:hypothetical protein